MANEIAASVSLSVSKNGAAIASGQLSIVDDMAGDQMITNVQAVGTSAEAVNLGDVSTVGYVLFKNMDATNYVELALASDVLSQIFAKLLPGDIALIPLATATIYAMANTAGVNLLVCGVER
jgi:hypothetical protein